MALPSKIQDVQNQSESYYYLILDKFVQKGESSGNQTFTRNFIREGFKKKNGLFSDIDQKGGWVSCINHYFLKP